eukprot:scaffold19114_cov118-Isochrysis_galbana.AAC.3
MWRGRSEARPWAQPLPRASAPTRRTRREGRRLFPALGFDGFMSYFESSSHNAPHASRADVVEH